MGQLLFSEAPMADGYSKWQKTSMRHKLKRPHQRLKDRFELTNIESNYNNGVVVTKFDYLIAFPRKESSNDFSIKIKRICWHDIKFIWKSAVPGSDEAKEIALSMLANSWKRRSGSYPTDKDHVSYAVWLMISRETIITELTEKSGLTIKIISTDDNIICLIYAPNILLESQAEREKYQLQFRQEIDPGSEDFWNNHPIELDEENHLYTKDEANIILEQLYLANKLSSEIDLAVFEEVEIDRTWSLRVHALERIADKVPVWNKYPACSEFTGQPHLRYLYQTYPPSRISSSSSSTAAAVDTITENANNNKSIKNMKAIGGGVGVGGGSNNTNTIVTNSSSSSSSSSVLFRMKDRLCLTKAILDRFFDLEKLMTTNTAPVVQHFMPLHAANYYEPLTLKILTNRWVYFWRDNNHRHDIGAPTVTDLAELSESPTSSSSSSSSAFSSSSPSSPSFNYNNKHNKHNNKTIYSNKGNKISYFTSFIHILCQPWYFYVFCQPFQDIRDYFGEKTTLYFAWVGCVTYHLLLPAFLGVALDILFLLRGYQNTTTVDWPLVAFLILNIVISVHSMRAWEKECSAISVKWGTAGYQATEKNRPQFRGDIYQPLKRSYITNIQEIHFPTQKRVIYIMGTYIVFSFALAISIGIVLSVFLLESIIMLDYSQYYFTGFGIIVNLIQVGLIYITSAIFNRITSTLTEWENHRSETNYEDSRILKTVLFQCTNALGVPLFTAFVKGSWLNSCESSCISDLRNFICVILVVQIVLRIENVVTPYIKAKYFPSSSSSSSSLATGGITNNNDMNNLSNIHQINNMRPFQPNASSFDNNNNNGINNNKNNNDITNNHPNINNYDNDDDEDYRMNMYLDEIQLRPHQGLFFHYSEIIMQQSYLSFFSIAFPALALIYCITNLIKIRLDAYKLCVLTQRPHVQLAENIGLWQNLNTYIISGGIITSVGIICFTMSDLENYTITIRFIIFCISFQILIFFQKMIEYLLSTQYDWIEEVTKRNKFIIQKYQSGYIDTDGENLIGKKLGYVFDTIQPDKYNLFDASKSKLLSEEDYMKIEQYETKKRELYVKLDTLKKQLQDVYRSETYNELTGIGETKHGLPLGRLNIHIFELQDYFHVSSTLPIHSNNNNNNNYIISSSSSSSSNNNSNALFLKVRVLIRGYKMLQAGPKHDLKRAETETKKLIEGNAVFNQALGPFAPIKTQDADVVFELVEVRTNAPDSVLSTASVRIRELLTQQPCNKVLNMSIYQQLDEGSSSSSSATGRLFVSLHFQYSKVVPIRNNIYIVQDKIRHIDKALQDIKNRKTSSSSSA